MCDGRMVVVGYFFFFCYCCDCVLHSLRGLEQREIERERDQNN